MLSVDESALPPEYGGTCNCRPGIGCVASLGASVDAADAFVGAHEHAIAALYASAAAAGKEQVCFEGDHREREIKEIGEEMMRKSESTISVF